MPRASHHVTCVTDDPEAVDRFLTAVVGLEVLVEFRSPGDAMTRALGWPASDGAAVKMYGKPPAGLVEVIAIPAELRGRVEPGISLISFAAPDLGHQLDHARRAGFDPDEPIPLKDGDVDIDLATVRVGGIVWEFVSFND